MSYSFSVRAATKHEAFAKAKEQFDNVVAQQPTHVQDKGVALAAVANFLSLLVDDETKDIQVSVHGSLSYSWAPDVDPDKVPLTGASVSVGVAHTTKEA